MKKYLLSKMVVVGVIFLFVVTSYVSAVNNNNKNCDKELVNKIENANHFLDILLYPTDDTQIRHRHPDDILGAHDVLKTLNEYGLYGSSGWSVDTLIRFDIPSILSNAQIISTLYLFYQSWGDTNPRGRPLNIYRITSEWDEDTCNWNNQPSYTYSSTSTSIIPSTPGIWMKWDVTNDVDSFLSGNVTNYGWMITDETYWGQPDIPRTRFWAKEHGRLIPYLKIDVFEPTITILIGRITDIDTTAEDYIRFNSKFLRFIQMSPFSFNRYTLGEEIIVSDSYKGILTPKFALGLFDAELWE